MSDTIINIHGGNNQILPNATQAVQNFYGGRSAMNETEEDAVQQSALSPAAELFSAYINNKVEDLPRYLSMLSACTTATELAQVVMTLLDSEPRITKEEVVKKRFIQKLLPLAPKLTVGNGENNIRARINDALAKHPKKRT